MTIDSVFFLKSVGAYTILRVACSILHDEWMDFSRKFSLSTAEFSYPTLSVVALHAVLVYYPPVEILFSRLKKAEEGLEGS